MQFVEYVSEHAEGDDRVQIDNDDFLKHEADDIYQEETYQEKLR